MAEDNTPTNVVDEMYKAGLEIFDENIFKNDKVDHIKFTMLLEDKGFTFEQVEDFLNKVYMAQSDDNPQGFENLSKEDWIKYTEPFIDTPTNVVDDGIDLYHSRAKGVDIGEGLHAGTYNAALDKAAMQYNNINFYNWAFDAQEQIAIAHNNLVDIVSGDLQLELEDLTEGNSIPFDREEPVYIEWVTGEETEYILKIEGEITLQDGEYINDLKANLYTADMDGFRGDLILELETDVSYADVQEIANNPDQAKISKTDTRLQRPGIDSSFTTNSLDIAEDLLEEVGTGYSFSGEKGYDLYKVTVKPDANILELPGEIILQIDGRDVTWTADELQNTLIDTNSSELTKIEQIIIGDKTIQIPDDARRKDVSKLLFGDYDVIIYKNQGEDPGSKSYLFKDSNSYTIEKIDDVKFNDDVNKKFYGTNKYDYYSDKAYKFKDQENFKKYQVKEYNPNFTFTDTPGGSLGAAKLNDPLVFDSWIDNYANTTTSFVDNLPLSTTVKNQFNNLVQGRAKNLATPGGVADAVDVWELGVLGLMIAAVAYKEYDEIPTILTNKAVDMFNSMTSSYGIPPVPKEQYDLNYEFINKVVETGEKFMPTDIIIKKVGEVVKGAAETGAVTGFGYVPTTPKNTDTMETTQKIQPGVQEEKMFEQAKPKKSKATGGAGAKIL